MKISANLDHGCIQTLIKIQDERLVASYIKTPPRAVEKFSWKKIDGLTYLLEKCSIKTAEHVQMK